MDILASVVKPSAWSLIHRPNPNASELTFDPTNLVQDIKVFVDDAEVASVKGAIRRGRRAVGKYSKSADLALFCFSGIFLGGSLTERPLGDFFLFLGF